MVTTINQAIDLVEAICHLPKNRTMITWRERRIRSSGLKRAIAAHDTAYLYSWLMEMFSYQGISDTIAADYIDRHGNADWASVAKAIDATSVRCGKLESFDTYKNCGFRKSTHSCAIPELIETCPVPRLPLRKGDLNQLAFSLFLFLRDRCHGDLVSYIDQVLAEAAAGSLGAETEDGRQALIKKLLPLHSVGPKLISLGLSNLLVAAGRQRPRWLAVGRSMIVVDTLIHNFLHRTGILSAFERLHSYGPRCYGNNGCEAILRDISARIDLKLIHPDLRSHNPRLVQSAIWQFCAEISLNVCNGRKIDDTRSCAMSDCPVGDGCSRVCLRPARPANIGHAPDVGSSAPSEHTVKPEGTEPSALANQSEEPVEDEDKSIRGRGGYRTEFLGSGRRPKPRRQVDCDSLCSYYAVVNALRWVLHPVGGLKSRHEESLFMSLIKAGRKRSQFHCFFTEGSNTEDLIHLAQAGAKTAVRIVRKPVVFKRWRSRRSSARREGLRRVVAKLTSEPNSAVIIGIEGRTLSHWSVVTKVTALSLILFDSSRMSRLPLERCDLSRRTYSKRRPRYWITVVGTLMLIGNNTRVRD